jgi:hypothetical protein
MAAGDNAEKEPAFRQETRYAHSVSNISPGAAPSRPSNFLPHERKLSGRVKSSHGELWVIPAVSAKPAGADR